MKRIIICLLSVMVILLCFSGCTNKYCAVSGCPSESLRRSDYCGEHNCMNASCRNKGIGSFGYCQECLDRAN